MIKEYYIIAGLSILSVALFADNRRKQRKVLENRHLAEILLLQNQTYNYMVKGFTDSSIDKNEYVERLNEMVKFVEIVSNEQ